MNHLEVVQSCPVCSGNKFSPFLVCKDYLVSQAEFSIQSCQTCGFRLTNPRPDSSSIGQYYKSDNYISHNDSGGGVIGSIYKGVRSYTLRSKLKLINSLTGQAGSLLDVGCGTGAFLQTCQEAGWRVSGMEPDQDARRIATEKLNIAVAPKLTDVANESYDIITLWHVLEHVAELNNTLDRFGQLVKASGTVLIAVPNSESYDAGLFGPHWAAYDVPRHLHHFTPATITRLFGKHGFTLVGQRPMVFDSFYISLLSTRYRDGSTSYVKSVQAGLRSNWEARKTGNWSSLIYLFRKA